MASSKRVRRSKAPRFVGLIEGERRDLNPRPPGPQPGALPTELRPPSRAQSRWFSAPDRDGFLGNRLHALDLLLLQLVARADDAERATAEARVGLDRKAADRVPAEALDLERVHPHGDGRVLAGLVVVIDRLADHLEVLCLSAAHYIA